jgi:hypothetical protein
MRYRTLLRTVPGAALILSLAACGSEHAPGDGAGGTGSVRPSASPATSLTVQVRASKDAAPTTWTLTCDPVGGNHPDGAKACAALRTGAATAFAKPRTDQMCTDIFGGPQTAEVTGTWNGKPVSATFGRADGCQVSRWNAVAPLFGNVVRN